METKLNPVQQRFMNYLIARNKDKPENQREIDDYLRIMINGYSSPFDFGQPVVTEVSPLLARRILRNTRLWPRIRRPEQGRINRFAELMKSGQWQVDMKQPVMISASGALLNGRHRLRAVVRSGTSALIPVIDQMQIINLIKS